MKKGKSNWLTVGYIPWVRPRNAATETDRKRLRAVRDTLFQRCLAVLMNTSVSASETGEDVTLAEHGSIRAVPRVVLYASDQPEERHVSGMQGA